ncbi:DUF6573 family protein [Streptomyces niveus]|uniref:DUF6573 family protein n=1 Tax=Streptomyces niveus TaxID=193462 RepID=UPI00368F6F1F
MSATVTVYTRGQAVRDGALVEADPDIAECFGFPAPVAMTYAVYAECIAVPEEFSWGTGFRLDETEREWDLLLTISRVIKAAAGSGQPPRLPVTLYRVPADGVTSTPRRVTLVAEVSTGDHGERVITIMRPSEHLPR